MPREPQFEYVVQIFKTASCSVTVMKAFNCGFNLCIFYK
ncbi:hypothetical protein NIES4071_11690 [Calothrix sp. NIES-4071]|nr:hypothetical protein NIES4071_11690 [Calothrix sp. NIES-4071]BAZ55509.1 hypothetical protein NIES4105_11650 [Calothrix sp. NIES-4105]